MTCIVGVVDKGKVYIGGDSAGVSGLNISIRKDPKVFKVKEFVIGCTSSFRMIQLLNFSFKPPVIKKDRDLYEYMCTDFVDAVRKCFQKGGYLQKHKDGDEMGGTFLIGIRGRLFMIENDFQVAENHVPFDSVGCGEPFAKAALHALHGFDIAPEEKIKRVLDIFIQREAVDGENLMTDKWKGLKRILMIGILFPLDIRKQKLLLIILIVFVSS